MHHDAVPILETVRQPIVLLATDFTVVLGNSAYYRVSSSASSSTIGQNFHDLWDGAFAQPALWQQLQQVLNDAREVRDFEITHTFPVIGRRTLILDARQLNDAGASVRTILIGLEDRTDAVAASQPRHAGQDGAQSK